MVRKMFALALVLVLAVSLAACTAPKNNPGVAGGLSGATQNSGNGNRAGQAGSGELISQEEAQRIALEHAGLKADQVTGLRVEYDVDDGVPEYDVEFHQGHWEYEYEIHAETGEIRSYDRDD